MADYLMPAPDSGAAGTEYQTVAALRRLGHEVDTVWADSLSHRVRHGNLHYLLELPGAYKATMLARMRRVNYDAIHVNQPHGYLAAKAAAALRGRTVFIHRSHGLELRAGRELRKWQKVFDSTDALSWPRLKASRMITWLLCNHSRAIARYASGHIVSAGDCATFLTSEMGVPAELVAVIPQAAPMAYTTKPAFEITPSRAKRVLYVGQYAFIKAPMIVAMAINRITQLDADVTATWVTAKASHGQVLELLSEHARARVTLRDWMPQQELIDVYDSHGIFLFPSFFEGFGKAFLEAMARGLCVIAADNGGAKDVITNGRDGLLVPTGDVEAMARACIDILASEGRREAMSREAASRARQYTWERVARETVAFYERRLKAERTSA